MKRCMWSRRELIWAKPLREASHCYEPKTNCSIPGLTDPVFEIPRVEAASITGGYVYLGDELPWLKGQYLVATF